MVHSGPKYLMFDHGGVLDNDMTLNRPGANDLLLSTDEEGYRRILKDGVSIVKNMNTLVGLGYKVIFHSKNSEEDQLRILDELTKSCAQKGLPFPKVHAMGVRNPKLYPGVSSSKPVIIRDKYHGILIAAYDLEKDGKACLREALSKLLSIKANDRKQNVVFDDGFDIIETAKQEGYDAYRIGDLNDALKQVMKKEGLSHKIAQEETSLINKMTPSLSAAAAITAIAYTQLSVNPFIVFPVLSVVIKAASVLVAAQFKGKLEKEIQGLNSREKECLDDGETQEQQNCINCVMDSVSSCFFSKKSAFSTEVLDTPQNKEAELPKNLNQTRVDFK